jgi:hypothetical protein
MLPQQKKKKKVDNIHGQPKMVPQQQKVDKIHFQEPVSIQW